MNNKPIRRFLRYVLRASLLLVLIAGAVTVNAAFPGANGKIAFSSFRDGNQEIYVMNPDGSGQTRLTDNPADDGAPAWSPDGTKIAFTSNRDGNYEIYNDERRRLRSDPAHQQHGVGQPSILVTQRHRDCLCE